MIKIITQKFKDSSIRRYMVDGLQGFLSESIGKPEHMAFWGYLIKMTSVTVHKE